MKFTWRCSGVSTRRKARAPAVILLTMQSAPTFSAS